MVLAVSLAEALEEAAAVHGDLLGFILSAGLVGLCMVLAFFVIRFGKKKFGSSCSEIARKIVHIGVSNWFFIYYFCFETSLWAIVGLAFFAVFNFVLTVSGGFSAIIGKQSETRSWGVVYYPLSLILLILLVEHGLGTKVDVGCALLGMGYGDGFAAILGSKYGQKKVFKNSEKSVVGSVTMWIIVSLLVFILKLWLEDLSISIFVLAICSILIGFVSSVAEALTPLGLDNVSVPIVVFLLASLI